MDVFEFDGMEPVERWEYFWEYGLFQDSCRKDGIDYFLFRHKEDSGIYMELFIHNDTSERGIQIIGGGEALAKYGIGQEDKPPPPWE